MLISQIFFHMNNKWVSHCCKKNLIKISNINYKNINSLIFLEKTYLINFCSQQFNKPYIYTCVDVGRDPLLLNRPTWISFYAQFFKIICVCSSNVELFFFFLPRGEWFIFVLSEFLNFSSLIWFSPLLCNFISPYERFLSIVLDEDLCANIC